MTIANTGASAVQAVVTAVAAPAQPLPAGGDGFAIERTYYRLDGSEANVTEVTQNERFVVVLKITEQNDWPSRVLVNDLLPAGFEIDNPRLVNSANLSNFAWLEQTEAAHLEFRDDRFVAAFDRDRRSGREFTLAYVVRAVTPGVYRAPGRRCGRHVPSAILGAHFDRHDGGEGARSPKRSTPREQLVARPLCPAGHLPHEGGDWQLGPAPIAGCVAGV